LSVGRSKILVNDYLLYHLVPSFLYSIWWLDLLVKMAPTCENNVQIKLTPKNFLLIIFNVVYIEVNETRKKL
jgi:hypothetical protein